MRAALPHSEGLTWCSASRPPLPFAYAAHDDVTRRRSHGNARVSVAVTPPPSRTAARHHPELQSGAIRNGRSAPTPALSPASQLILSLLESSELSLTALNMSKPLSGAQKRKKKQELEEKICRIPKITGFLLPTSGSSAQPSACGSSKEHASTCSQEEIPPQSVSEYGSEVNTVDSSDQPMSLETTPVPMEVEKPSFHTVEIQDATAEAVDIPPKSMEKSGFLTDIGLWPNSSTLEMREYWSKNGNSPVRKPLEKLRNEGFPKSFKDGRCCTADMFLRNCPNGDKVERKWLCYSNNRGRIYCFDCKLFSSSTNAFSSDGFSDWKHASERISSHEQSQHHIRAVIDTAKFSKLEGRIDYKMQQQIEELTTYGQNLVKRLLSVIVFLAERGLAFRGDDQTIGSPHNGNYLGILELLSEYDAFLAQHIQTKANKGKGCTSYLSANVCEELIQITGDKILEVVINRIKMAKYYLVVCGFSGGFFSY
ncbi:Hypothetical predicted protein [Pelobates cultripes]|uniref:Zinc finger MYM-type protein 1 n=1 Tax=Pelobates cultripes TaxID=61616 RepID=A0AAD1SHC5_PELCU|nr:Hypothetical predicted protein [Pelobates cultripes]